MLFCPLLLSLLCCVASSPVDTVGSWEPLETALDSCALSAHVRTFSHQGGVMVKVSTLLRLIGCWVIIAVDSWRKLNSHFGDDDGLEQLVAYFKNCVRKVCSKHCISSRNKDISSHIATSKEELVFPASCATETDVEYYKNIFKLSASQRLH